MSPYYMLSVLVVLIYLFLVQPCVCPQQEKTLGSYNREALYHDQCYIGKLIGVLRLGIASPLHAIGMTPLSDSGSRYTSRPLKIFLDIPKKTP